MPIEIDIGNKGIVLNEGDSWKENRRLVFRELIGSKDKSKVVGQIFDELTTKVGAAAAANADGKVPELGALIHKAVATGMCLLIFGSAFKPTEDLMNEILEHVDFIGAKCFDYMFLIRFPFYRLFGFETVRRFEATCQRMVKIVHGVLEQRTEAEDEVTGMATIDTLKDGKTSGDSPSILSEVLYEAL